MSDNDSPVDDSEVRYESSLGIHYGSGGLQSTEVKEEYKFEVAIEPVCEFQY